MEGITTPPQEAALGSYITPLLVSVVGIVSASLAVVIYHLIIIKYCQREQPHRQEQDQDQTTNTLEMGLDDEALKTIPILFYTSSIRDLFRMDLSECVVCLGQIEVGDLIRWLPNCKHVFHVPCIDDWLHAHANCPICRAPVVESISNPIPNSPVSDALSEDSSHGGDHIDKVEGGDASTSQARLTNVLCNFGGFQPRDPLCAGLKRSLSMDHSRIIVNIQREIEYVMKHNIKEDSMHPMIMKTRI
ncbi:hypothetical protein Ancab_031777 [Ancistrocladus abbreviatus]